MATKRKEWTEVIESSPPEPAREVQSTRYRSTKNEPHKTCNKCNRELPVSNFEGFKRCRDCRERSNRSWHRLQAGYKRAGVGQRIALSDENREKVLTAFLNCCAFCGSRTSEDKPLRLTRLILPRAGGGDELFNVIPTCTSCLQSRKGWADWSDWFKSNADVYSPVRYARLMAWHNEKPLPPISIHTRPR